MPSPRGAMAPPANSSFPSSSPSKGSHSGHHHHHHHHHGRGRLHAVLLLQIVAASLFLIALSMGAFGGGVIDGGSFGTRLRSSAASAPSSSSAVPYQAQSYLDRALQGSKQPPKQQPTAQQQQQQAAQDGLCITEADLAASHTPGGHHVIVASPLRNGRDFLPAFLESLAAQRYPRLTVVVYDDASDDGGPDFLDAQAPHLPFRLLVVRGDERRGPAYAKWRLIEEIRRGVKEDPMDLVLFLDADDKLAHPRVLEEVDGGFQTHKPWFAWGRIRGYYEEECGPAPPITYTNGTSSVRSGPWRYCHPRILRAFLLDFYDESDFRDVKRAGKPWLQKYTDRQLVYKALELSGDDRVRFLDAPNPHVYYRLTANSTVFLDPKIKQADLAYVNALPAASKRALPAPVHIVTCAFARVALLREVLAANIEAQELGPDAPPIYLHVCNNNPDPTQHAYIESVLKNVTGLAGYRLQTFPDNPGGFARFRMMQNALREFPVDHFVMIDDDIKLPPKDGLRTLLAHAKPREYNSWWGRHYKPAADYYFSRLSPRDLKAGLKGQAGTKGAVTTFHYAGTGLAVLDADMVRLHYPLLEKLPAKYRKVEDLWLSYVAYQVGWRVRRIPMAGVGFLEDNHLNPDGKSAALVQSTALWRQLKNGKEGDLKKMMLEDLRKCGWNVR